MSAVRKGQLRLLEPYLEGNQPTHTNAEGEREWNMHCPLHGDSKRSASLNVDTGEWYCFAGCGGGTITQLLAQRHAWENPPTAASNGTGMRRRGAGSDAPEHVSEAMVDGWHSALLSNDSALEAFMSERGLTYDTIVAYEIGWDRGRGVYTIPVRSPEGDLWNVRRYHPHPPAGRRKIYGVKGMNTPPRLYPIASLEDSPEHIIITEGELDALITIQNGYRAITRTGTADHWTGEWGELFAGMTVYVCQDMDTKGQAGNRKIARALYRTSDVRILKLPYPVTDDHGQDLTDFWLEHDRADFERLLTSAEPFKQKKETDEELETITVLDSFDAKKIGKPVQLIVTIKGRKEPGYSVPKKVQLACTRDAGTKCQICPLFAAGGEAELDIDPDDPAVLSFMDIPTNMMLEEIRKAYGAQKCTRLQFEVEEHQAVEVLFGRPALDYSDGTKAGDYKNIKVTSVGRHDTMPNNTVMLTGALHPSPKAQTNEFLAWEREKMETSVDRFIITPESVALMKRFQPRKGQRPLKKLGEVSRVLSEHVTRIHGRPEMHALMDLTFHSALSFKFAGEMIAKGWLESLIVGDTRTGKSFAAERLMRHYGAGEMISGEAASFAGIVGGLQQLGGKDWAVTWGVIPINDRRIVVLDEAGGLTPEEISQMSDVRSSGVAKLTKIQQEVTWARTRLLWLSNPRGANMSMDWFTYGVDAIRPLIGNTEDIARFDLAMAVSTRDVDPDTINQAYEIGELKYTAEACHQMLMWAWTRQPDQIKWAGGAEKKVFELANDMGARYVEDPPLVQAANIRIKIARVAVALAARTFSTDSTHERVVVTKEHVEDAVAFMDRIYGMQAFGYRERSEERIADRKEAESKKRDISQYLKGRPTLGKYLRGTGSFRRQDLEEVLNVSREEANAIINTLWEARMVRKDKGDVRVEPTLHALLREVKW